MPQAGACGPVWLSEAVLCAHSVTDPADAQPHKLYCSQQGLLMHMPRTMQSQTLHNMALTPLLNHTLLSISSVDVPSGFYALLIILCSLHTSLISGLVIGHRVMSQCLGGKSSPHSASQRRKPQTNKPAQVMGKNKTQLASCVQPETLCSTL